MIYDLDKILTNDSKSVSKIQKRISESQYKFTQKSDFSLKTVPDNIFFIWLGELNPDKLKYLDIWKQSVKSITLWIDSRTILYSCFWDFIQEFSNQSGRSVIDSQTYFYNTMRKEITLNRFDHALVQFARMNLPDYLDQFNRIIKKHTHELEKINKDNLIIRDLTDHTSLLNDEMFRFYSYEIALRNNLAAASDIVRLNLLHQYGGVYVDVDTMVDFRLIFKKTYHKAESSDISLNLLDAFISDTFYRSFHPGKSLPFSKKYQICRKYIEKYQGMISSIDNDIEQWNGTIPIFNLPVCAKNSIRMSINTNNTYEYNNNVIASHAGSKLLKIVIFEMKRRYNYLEKNGYVFLDSPESNSQKQSYYERLKDYRFDLKNAPNYTTLILSGPSLILEVVLGCAASVLNTEITSEALSLAIRYGHLFEVGIANQVMFTLEHLDSSWMQNHII